MQANLRNQFQTLMSARIRLTGCILILAVQIACGQRVFSAPALNGMELNGNQSGKKGISLLSTIGATKSPSSDGNSSLIRKVFNISLGTVTLAGITGWVAMDMTKDKLRSEANNATSLSQAIEKEIQWEETLSRRNLFGTIALGSGTILAVSIVFPIGDHDGRGLFERSRFKRKRDDRERREDS